jgi:pimeloyl-ACP methyl ester carboxylesterase
VDRVCLDLPRGAFHALVGGDGSRATIVYLHGFPDHPPTAVPFLRALIARGHRVIAPWLRGYAPSPLAGPFDLDTLVADVIAIVARAGERIALVGHDWGAVLTYGACIAAPDRIARAVTIAVPHPLTFLRRLATTPQALRSWYMAMFALPGAKRIVAARDLAFVDRLWRTWSPALALDAAQRAELHACLAASLPAPLAYYRAILAPGFARRFAALAAPIRVPLLQLHGADDGCILPPGAAMASGCSS